MLFRFGASNPFVQGFSKNSLTTRSEILFAPPKIFPCRQLCMCRAYRQLCLPVSQVSAFLRFQTGPNAFTLKAPRRSQPSLWCSQATGTSALDCPLFEQCSGCNIDNALDKPPLSGRAASYVQEVHPQAVFSAEPCRQTHGEARRDKSHRAWGLPELGGFQY